jgi:hypothetical protein
MSELKRLLLHIYLGAQMTRIKAEYWIKMRLLDIEELLIDIKLWALNRIASLPPETLLRLGLLKRTVGTSSVCQTAEMHVTICKNYDQPRHS